MSVGKSRSVKGNLRHALHSPENIFVLASFVRSKEGQKLLKRVVRTSEGRDLVRAIRMQPGGKKLLKGLFRKPKRMNARAARRPRICLVGPEPAMRGNPGGCVAASLEARASRGARRTSLGLSG